MSGPRPFALHCLQHRNTTGSVFGGQLLRWGGEIAAAAAALHVKRSSSSSSRGGFSSSSGSSTTTITTTKQNTHHSSILQDLVHACGSNSIDGDGDGVRLVVMCDTPLQARVPLDCELHLSARAAFTQDDLVGGLGSIWRFACNYDRMCPHLFVS